MLFKITIALWTWTDKVFFGLRRHLVLNVVSNNFHYCNFLYFQRFKCLICIFKKFFNSIFYRISAILLNKTSKFVKYLVNYKNLQECSLLSKLTHRILNTFCERSFLVPEGSIRFWSIQKFGIFLSDNFLPPLMPLWPKKNTLL